MVEAPDNFEDWFAPNPAKKGKPEEETSTFSIATTTNPLTTKGTYLLATETSTLTTVEQEVTTATTEISTATTVATPTYFLLQMILIPVVLLLVAMTTVLVVREVGQSFTLVNLNLIMFQLLFCWKLNFK